MAEVTVSAASLGYRTDLMLHTLQQSVVEERDGFAVIRTPANPAFRWGNFLLLPGPPAPGSVDSWVTTFQREFPAADWVTLGVDGATGEAGRAEELGAAGFRIERNTVLAADSVRLPPRPNRAASFRPLERDEEWAAALALREAANDGEDSVAYREFATRKMAAMRRLQEGGHGSWFGAFLNGRMVSGLGVFTDGSGIARFQSVDTHPAHRNQGLAGTLVHTAGEYALSRLGAKRLVMVADPTYHAIRVYRSVGFRDVEKQVQLERFPS